MEEFKRISRDLVAKGAIIDYYQDMELILRARLNLKNIQKKKT